VSDSSLLQRLKERKLVQWALAYLAGAFVVFQAVEVMAEPWGISGWLQRSIHILLRVGVFVTLVLAWYHGEKGLQRVGGVEVLILAVLLGGGGLWLTTVRREDPAARSADAVCAWLEVGEESRSRRSVAVLPFQNISGDSLDLFFTDGIHDEIITQLHKIASLDVRSRTSVLKYGDSRLSTPEIARELCVTAVLEGSVRRGGPTIRVTAQLIDGRSDEHLWSETFDRTPSPAEAIAIQTDIARRIAQALQVELKPAEERRISQVPTDIPAAYELYLRAGDYRRRGYLAGANQERGRLFELSVRRYEDAVEVDPTFAEAWARLGFQHLDIYDKNVDRSPARLARSKEAIDQALELDPELPLAHWALGSYYNLGEADATRASREAAIALEGMPGNPEVYTLLGSIRIRQGRLQEAIDAFERSARLDPRPEVLVTLANVLISARRYQEAEAWLNLSKAMSPEYPFSHRYLAELYPRWNGDLSEARTILDQAGSSVEEDELLAARFWNRIYARDYRGSLELLRPDAGWLGHVVAGGAGPVDLLYGVAHRLLGDSAQAASHFQRVVDAGNVPRDPLVALTDARLASAVAQAGAGREEEALRELQAARELFLYDPFTRAQADEVEIHVRVMLDDHDRALDIVEDLLELEYRMAISVQLLRIDPRLDPLRDHPRFQALLEKHGAN
jgi:TolB-like protein/Tfp pilus assembly protein PilF